jgi:hypothetical protein
MRKVRLIVHRCDDLRQFQRDPSAQFPALALTLIKAAVDLRLQFDRVGSY